MQESPEVIWSSAATVSLGERLALVRETWPHARLRPDAKGVRRDSWLYLVDVNQVTTAAAIRARASRKKYVVDTGDDAHGLGYALGKPAPRRLVERSAERAVLGGAARVIYRGINHVEVMPARVARKAIWIPDTCPDWLLDSAVKSGRPTTFATFGFVGADLSRGLGTEVIEALLAGQDLEAIVVAYGPGVETFRTAAAAQGVAGRLQLHSAMPLEDLVATLADAGSVAFFQSMDRAGNVRTTGKLPIALGMGKAVLTTCVGEAARALPAEWLVSAADRRDFARWVSSVAHRSDPRADFAVARTLAESYRRSRWSSALRGI